MSGAALTDQVVDRLRPALGPLGLDVDPSKQDAIEAADVAGTTFMAFFTTFGSFSIAAGILLIFLVFVMLAAERRGELGIARAIGTRRGHLVETFTFEGAAYDLVAALVGALIGAGVAFLMVLVLAHAFSAVGGGLEIEYAVTPRSLAIAFALGVLLTLTVVAFSAWRVSAMTISTAIRNLPEPAAPHRRRRLVLALIGLALGILLVVSGMAGRCGHAADPRRLARARQPRPHPARPRGPRARRLHGLRAGDRRLPAPSLERVGSGVRAALHELLHLDRRGPHDRRRRGLDDRLQRRRAARADDGVFGRIRRLAPVLKMSMAYPLASRFRTGTTLAMFTLVVFTLVTGTTSNRSFLHAAGDLDTFGGGFDVRASTSGAAPIGDISTTALKDRRRGSSPTDFTVAASQSYLPIDATQRGTGRPFESYVVRGLDTAFLEHTTFRLGKMAPGYDSPKEVWDAIASRDNLAVVDSTIVPRRDNWNFGPPPSDFRLSGFYFDEGPFEPVGVDVRDPQTGRIARLTVIGILSDSAPLDMAGISTSQATLDRAFPGRAIGRRSSTSRSRPASTRRRLLSGSSPRSSPPAWRRSRSRTS